MQLTCLYHPVNEMLVTDDEEQFNRLLASGVWFKHPNQAKEMRIKHEKQIRSECGKGRVNSKRKTKEDAGDAR